MIIVVEDDATLAGLVASVAQRAGSEAVVFGDADDALRAIVGLAEPPSLVLLDLALPGNGGDWLCAEIRRNPATSSVRVVLLSGNRDAQESARACGADGVLRKPFTLEELEGLMRGFGKDAVRDA
jgi:two-component system, OmpR family, phosphate regulon response regulator PhoB